MRAYTIETVITRGCHEEITGDALRRVRTSFPEATAALPARGDDRAFIDDVPFRVPDDLDDIGAVTLILGARDNDLKGNAAAALDQTAVLNGDPKSQREHCLRAPDDVEPGGSRAALDDCRAFIRDTLLAALDGLDVEGRPDGALREELDVTLAFRGRLRFRVPVFYLRAGRALHTIQDSFTHTFRSADDPRKVTVVLNWVKYAEGDIHEETDGPPHLKELDRCDDPDGLRTERRRLAVEASAAALGALLDPSVPRAEKGPAVDAVLDEYLAFDADALCSANNRWCNAPELAYVPSDCGCSLGARGSTTGPLLSLLSVLAAVVARRRRGKATCTAAALLVALIVTTAPPLANADESAAEEPSALESPLRALDGGSKAGARGEKDEVGVFFARAALGASYDKPAFSGGLGARYQLSKPLMLGFDAEWNPFYVPSPISARLGVVSAYVSLIRRFQLENDSYNIRTTAALGGSMLLFDLVGAPKGSVGPFFGLSFLGVEWKASPGFYVTIDPSYIAFPVPHLTGAPFGYLQYRFLVGVEFGGK